MASLRWWRLLVLLGACSGWVAPASGSAQEGLGDHPGLLWLAAQVSEERVAFPEAASLYERYVARCIELPLADLAPDGPCAHIAFALERAFQLRRALGHVEEADADAVAYELYFLYARPRAALRIAYERVRLNLDAGRVEPARAAVAAFEARGGRGAPRGHGLVAAGLAARLAALTGDRPAATDAWRDLDRAFRLRHPLPGDEDLVPWIWVAREVAEARVQAAEAHFARFQRVRPPRSPRDDETVEGYVRRTLTPWLVRLRRKLLRARHAFEEVYELGSPAHSVVSAARIGELYRHLGDLHGDLPLQGGFMSYVIREGEDRPGLDMAVSHLETCIRWATTHAVAPRWAARCEEELAELSPSASARLDRSVEGYGPFGALAGPTDGLGAPAMP
ncbi:MAG: hypothetical protein ACFCGT_25055 [Sandaracinaceae bacterium]